VTGPGVAHRVSVSDVKGHDGIDYLIAWHYIPKKMVVQQSRLRSLGPMLGALGMKLIAVEDPEAVARFTSRLPALQESCVQPEY
jgi:hypothetical protein